MKILLIAGGYIGDTLWAMQAVPMLKEHFTGAEIYAAVKPVSKAVLPDGVKYIQNAFLVSDRRREHLSLAGLVKEALQIRKQYSPDLVFDMMGNKFSAIYARIISSNCIGPELGNNFSFLYARKIQITGIHLMCRPLETVGKYISKDYLSETKPLLPPPVKYTQNEIKTLLNIPENKKIAVLFPSAGWKAKCWQPEKYAAVAEHLNKKGYIVFVSGAANEKELLEKAAGKFAKVLCIPLEQLFSLLPLCDLCIGNDTGTMHAAASFNVKCLTIFCQSDPATAITPNKNAFYIRNKCPQIYSDNKYCRLFPETTCRSECFMSVTPEEVIAKLHEILSE